MRFQIGHPMNKAATLILTETIAPLVTVLLLIFLCQKFKLFAPHLSSLVLGGRS